MPLFGVLGTDTDALITTLFTKPGVTHSFSAILVSMIIAALFLAYVYYSHTGRIPSLKKIALMVFPKRLIANKTHIIDLTLYFVNSSAIFLLFAWMVVSIHFVNITTSGLLVSMFGPSGPTTLDSWVVMTIMTVVLYLAYEFSYWLDHYLSHAIPFLWEFHRVHHEAEVLTPATAARVHPMDQVVFTNITMIITGITNGVLTYSFGQEVGIYTLYGLNIILFFFVLFVIQLQHTHVWIPFTGLAGRILMSPAHHQIHHSTRPEHFNRNLGSSLCVFDWLFGTLYIPSKKREKLSFGVEQEHHGHDPQTIEHALLNPFVRAYRHLVPRRDVAPERQPAGSLTKKPLAPAE